MDMDGSQILMLLLGTAFIGAGVYQVLHRFYLKKRCTEQVPGTVSGVWRKRVRGRKTATRFFVEYTYSVEGAEYVKKPSVSRSEYQKLKHGDSVTVCYDPAKPKRCHVLELEFRVAVVLGFLAGGGFCFFLAFM